MTEPLEVSDATFESDVLKSNLPILVDFWAEWCMPCKALAPALHEITKAYEGKLRVAKLDVDANVSTTMQFQIMGIPTLILFKDGKPVERTTGLISKEKLITKLEPHLQ